MTHNRNCAYAKLPPRYCKCICRGMLHGIGGAKFKPLDKFYENHALDALIHAMGPDIRYYRGVIKCEILLKAGRGKVQIRYMESGEVGPKGLKKIVYPGEIDITMVRLCWRKRK